MIAFADLLHRDWSGLKEKLLAREAMAFYERKDLEGGIELMLRGVEGRSDPSGVLLYQLACFESLAGKRDAAVEHLGAAIEVDPSWREDARADSDFDPLRDDPALQELLLAPRRSGPDP